MPEQSSYFSVGDIPKRMSQKGYPRPHMSTCYRWAYRGARGVKLSTILVGGSRLTCEEWLDEFISRLNIQPTAQTRATSLNKQADEFLDAEGL